MKKTKGLFCFLFALFYLAGCKNNQGGYSKIILFTRAPLYSKLYVNQLPFYNEKPVIVDSAIIRSNKDSIILFVPNKVERIFSIDVKETRLKIVIINDSPEIRVHADYFSNKYTVTGSKATISLKNFEDGQLIKAMELQKIKQSADSLRALNVSDPRLNALNDSLSARFTFFNKQYINFADTVSSPAAFMKVYDNVDFGDDYKSSKKFILHSSSRFPHYKPLQDFKKEVLATIRIYEEEFLVGNKLPSITLPDINDKPFSTSSIKNKYYLIDFWSTLCRECMFFKVEEKKIADKFPAEKLQIVSVAIDDEKDIWKKIVYGNKYNWTQLIDVKMWQGPAARTLLFDSIPFNFLVSPQGIIIKKAIKPDSLKKVISKLNLN